MGRTGRFVRDASSYWSDEEARLEVAKTATGQESSREEKLDIAPNPV